MLALKWVQVNAWRLSQHHLIQRAGRRQLLDVLTHIGGAQAQLMSAAELTLGTRIDGLSPVDVRNALWRDRSIVKSWIMRGTLHLLTASEFSLYVAARSAQLERIRRPPSYYKYHQVTPTELDAIIEGVPKTLTDVPMTREQLATALAKRAHNPKLRDVLLSGWGALLKPSALRGDLCFGPSQGQNVTFVRPDRWLRQWNQVESETALKEIGRRYLRAYGPAIPDDFARWWGCEASQAKKLFRALGAEIEAVTVEGWKAWGLVSTLEQMKSLKPSHTVRLLPPFDAYILGVSRDCEPLLPKKYKSRVYRTQGWISAVVLVDGRMEGIWQYDDQNSRIVVSVELFRPPTASIKRGIKAEVRRLAEFLGVETELIYAQP